MPDVPAGYFFRRDVAIATPAAPSIAAPAMTAATPFRVRFFDAAGLVSFQRLSASSVPALQVGEDTPREAPPRRNHIKYTAETPLAPVGVLLTDFVLTGSPPLGVPPLLSSWLEVEMIRMRWLALALVCAATTAVSAQETRDTTKGKIKTATTKAAKNTKKAVVTGAKDTKNAVVTGAKDTKKAVVTGAKDTKKAVVTGAKDTKNAVKKGASDTKTAVKKTTHAVKAAVKKDTTKKP